MVSLCYVHVTKLYEHRISGLAAAVCPSPAILITRREAFHNGMHIYNKNYPILQQLEHHFSEDTYYDI